MKIISHGQTDRTQSDRSEEIQNLQNEYGSFKLGKFLIDNLGLNGFWTSYILNHPDRGRLSGKNENGDNIGKAEKWLLNSCPIFLATQERFRIFKQVNSSLICNEFRGASIPCGLMDDLLQLDYQNYKNISLVGIDLDPASIELANANASKLKKNVSVQFLLQDAWQWQAKNEFDLITSNGLNIYVEDDEKCIELYQNLSNNLKQGGALVISFITPVENWQPYSQEDLAFQKYIFKEVIPVKWQCLRSEEQTRLQLESCGFKIEKIIFDTQRMFPTVLAIKS